jgi:hypothetical protein
VRRQRFKRETPYLTNYVACPQRSYSLLPPKMVAKYCEDRESYLTEIADHRNINKALRCRVLLPGTTPREAYGGQTVFMRDIDNLHYIPELWRQNRRTKWFWLLGFRYFVHRALFTE